MKNSINQVITTGIQYDDAIALRRISMALRRWYELECGDGNGYIERRNGKPYYYRANHSYIEANDPRAWRRVPDRETGALKRLAKIMASYPDLTPYVQVDPRGCALYILRPNDVPYGKDADAYYSRGVPVY